MCKLRERRLIRPCGSGWRRKLGRQHFDYSGAWDAGPICGWRRRWRRNRHGRPVRGMALRFERVADSRYRVEDVSEDRSDNPLSKRSGRQGSAAFRACAAIRVAIQLRGLRGRCDMRSIGERLNMLRHLLSRIRATGDDAAGKSCSAVKSKPGAAGSKTSRNRCDAASENSTDRDGGSGWRWGLSG